MVVRINELNVKSDKPPPAAFQGKSIEDVVVGLIQQVNQLTVKLNDGRERIRELETTVNKLLSLTQSLQQTANQQGPRLQEHEAMLSDHDMSLSKLNAVFKLELLGGSWSGTLGPEHLTLRIKAKEVKVESLSTLTTKSTHGTGIDSGGSLSLYSSGAAEMSFSSFTVSSGWLTVNSGLVNSSAVIKCDTLVAKLVAGSSYTPGPGNTW